jgi:hypothetical protein
MNTTEQNSELSHNFHGNSPTQSCIIYTCGVLTPLSSGLKNYQERNNLSSEESFRAADFNLRPKQLFFTSRCYLENGLA